MNRLTSLINLEKAWAVALGDVLGTLRSEKETGLSVGEVQKRFEAYGSNELRKHKSKSLIRILFDQVKSLIVALLAVAATLSFLYNEIIEGWAIVAVLVINTAIGFFTELRAVRSMEALFEMGKMETRVRRDGEVKTIDASDLVPGDIVLFEGGDIITADIRILEASKLQADESALTGESLPVQKSKEPVPGETVLAERSSMLYKGTAITRGAGEGVVVSTGERTELGHISLLVEEAEDEQTPLEERLDQLGYRLIFLTLIVTVFIAASGILTGKDVLLMVETGIALAVAAIPEGLPIVATIALAKGMRILARKNALINRLSSVETLGATETIFTDKTGTLTENRMSVRKITLSDEEIDIKSDTEKLSTENSDLNRALETAVLCNNATWNAEDKSKGSGDPLEIALLEVAALAGYEREKLTRKYPESREEAFDPEVKMMATWNRIDSNSFLVSVKGAPEAVVERCESLFLNGEPVPFTDEMKKEWLSKNDMMAANGLRVIALASKESNRDSGTPYENLSFSGMMGLLDPPREDVKGALEACREAGISVVMVTGDQPHTAKFIGQSVGLVDSEHNDVVHGSELSIGEDAIGEAKLREASIYARISPSQKLDLIEWYQNKGHVVGMTGDGVNDAPALKKADIGIAMGQRGTQVAKEASDMVLLDDAFSTIVTAIRQGRIIFENIRRFVYYLLSCNVSEVLVVGVASFLGTPLPILPLQILFLNLVTDVFPALALGVGEGQPGIMKQPPRKENEAILDRRHWVGIIGYSLIITVVVMAALLIALYWMGLDSREAVTLSFLTLAFAQLLHVFNMREKTGTLFNNSVVSNKWVWYAIVLCVGLIIGAVSITPVAEVMQLRMPNREGWLLVAILSVIPLLAGQLQKYFASKN